MVMRRQVGILQLPSFLPPFSSLPFSSVLLFPSSLPFPSLPFACLRFSSLSFLSLPFPFFPFLSLLPTSSEGIQIVKRLSLLAPAVARKHSRITEWKSTEKLLDMQKTQSGNLIVAQGAVDQAGITWSTWSKDYHN